MPTPRHLRRSYRAAGRDHLQHAKDLLAAGEDASLVYAVLQLRMALEAHVYASAENYLDELPEPQLAKWQPPALLRELLTIDPHIDTTSTISFARETSPGVAGPEWFSIGTQKKMTLKEIDRAYHRLGSFLHIETVLDRAEGKERDYARLRETCDALAERLTDIFSTTLHNFKMSTTAQIECFVCSKLIKRRLSNLKPGGKIGTECGAACYATYTIELLEKGKVHWQANFEEAPCANEGCTGTIQIWEKHLEAGNAFRCDTCGRATEIIFGLRPVLPEGDHDVPPEARAGTAGS